MKKLTERLKSLGYEVSHFATKEEAAAYVAGECRGKTIGIGGCMTAAQMDLYAQLEEGSTVYSHAKNGSEAIKLEGTADVYILSANAIAETGEIVNIDGTCNRVADAVYGHERVIYLIGKNKIVPTLEDAIYRARNIASPLNARRLKKQTPCALTDPPRCHDCSSPDRICRSMSIQMGKTKGIPRVDVVLIDEELGF